MNLQKLFSVQKVLRERINYNEPDRFNKLILALLVELGELAQEWRGFKFWSKDQEPRTTVICPHCDGKGFNDYFDAFEMFEGQHWTEPCEDCKSTGFVEGKNPLLEEFVDGLHFVLELGIDLNYKTNQYNLTFENTVTEQFREIYFFVSMMDEHSYNVYERLVRHYLGLGVILGFTWDQIEQAYLEKNAINHQRQDSGY